MEVSWPKVMNLYFLTYIFPYTMNIFKKNIHAMLNAHCACMSHLFWMSFLETQCFKKDHDFYGNDVKSVSASSPNSCQIECQHNEDCEFWTYREEKNSKVLNCWLKSNNNFRVWKKDRIAGPKYCGKEIIKFIISISHLSLILLFV